MLLCLIGMAGRVESGHSGICGALQDNEPTKNGESICIMPTFGNSFSSSGPTTTEDMVLGLLRREQHAPSLTSPDGSSGKQHTGSVKRASLSQQLMIPRRVDLTRQNFATTFARSPTHA